MLKKLLKYDLKCIFKFLSIFYLLSLFFSILTRIFLGIDSSFMMNIIGQVCGGATIAMIVNILINNLMRLWVRFKNNFYGDESYLTHTLPVEKKTLYVSKVLTSVISLCISFLVIVLTLFIAYYSKENLELLKKILLPVANMLDSTVVIIILSFLIVFFLEMANVLQAGYMGMILGHRMNNNKLGFSVLFGFIVYIFTQIIAVIIMFIGALFNRDLMNLFITNEIINVDMIKFIIYLAMFIYILTLVIGYVINIRLFKKEVNVD